MVRGFNFDRGIQFKIGGIRWQEMKYKLIQSIYLLLSFPSQLFPALTESSQTTNGQKCSFYEIESHKIRYFLSLLLLAGMTP